MINSKDLSSVNQLLVERLMEQLTPFSNSDSIESLFLNSGWIEPLFAYNSNKTN